MLPGLAAFLRDLWRRHRWSLPLSLCSSFFVLRLASEVREGELDWFDGAVQSRVDSFRGTLDSVMLGATGAGGVVPMSVLTALALVALLIGGRAREARFLFTSAGGSLALNVLLKIAFHRLRPSSGLPYLIPRPTSFSFPSGHTMGTTSVIGSLVVVCYALSAPRPVRWIASTFGCVVVLSVGTSRIYLGAHYPSDVLGGFLAAAAWVSAVTGWFYPGILPGEAGALPGDPPGNR